MSTCASMKVVIGNQFEINQQYLKNNTFDFQIPLNCPYCVEQNTRVGTWGSYETKADERIRFRCYTCGKTFNTAKLPYWETNLHEMVWKLAQLTVEQNYPVHRLSKQWNVPESSLRRLVTELKVLFSSSFEQIKQAELLQNSDLRTNSDQLKVIIYDEGFLKLLGVQAYLVFTLDHNGRPLTLQIEADRKTETIYNHFLSAMIQLGGVDVIISDGAPAILAAAKALRQDLTAIIQIHQDGGKRCRIVRLKTNPNMKRVEETTIEMHTGSLLLNTEVVITVAKKNIYPQTLAGNNSLAQKTKHQKKDKEQEGELSEVIESDKDQNSKKQTKKKKTALLKGEKIILTTGPELGIFELSYIDPLSFSISKNIPSLQEIHGMISLVQNVLPNQWITSNRAEVFNALHDRVLTYHGRKTFCQANRDLLAWAVMKFYPDIAKKKIQRHNWRIPVSLLKGLWPLLIAKVKKA